MLRGERRAVCESLCSSGGGCVVRAALGGRKKPDARSGLLKRKEKLRSGCVERLTAPTLHCELHARVANEALQVLVLLWIEVLGFFELFLGAPESFLDGFLVDLLFGNRVLSQDMDAVALDFD